MEEVIYSKYSMDRAKALNIAIPENLITKNTKIIENKK